MSKKVLITGVTGQDGSYMADLLLEETDYEIYGMVRRTSTKNYKNIEHLLNNPRFKTVTGDLSDSQSSEDLGNVDYSPQDEKHPLKPRSPYGAAKAAARHIVKVYRESYNLFAIQGLLYNHESERRGEEFVTRKITKNVARIKKALNKNEKFEPLELGNIDAKRDWSHAKDFVRGIWIMLNQEEPKEYLLSSNETHTVKEFIEKSFKLAGIYGTWKNGGVEEKFVLNKTDNSIYYDDQILVQII